MGKEIKIIPSIASADQLRIGEEIKRLHNWRLLHIDIEDGNFVPNITFGEKTVRAVAAAAPQELDAHLLVRHPETYLDMLKECGVSKIAVHIEALDYPLETLRRVRKMGISPGLAVNLKTMPDAIEMFKNDVDYILVMTAEPDFCGNEFYPPVLEKMERIRGMMPEAVEIWADGGIHEKNMEAVIGAGATTLIMGRSIFGNQDTGEGICRIIAGRNTEKYN